jgi:hypothetical protein
MRIAELEMRIAQLSLAQSVFPLRRRTPNAYLGVRPGTSQLDRV